MGENTRRMGSRYTKEHPAIIYLTNKLSELHTDPHNDALHHLTCFHKANSYSILKIPDMVTIIPNLPY